MKLTRTIFILLAAVFLLTSPASAELKFTPLVEEYVKAHKAKDEAKKEALVDMMKAKVPGEIKGLIYQSYSAANTKEDKEAALYVAEEMSKTYHDITGDYGPLKEVKRAGFESLLSKAIVSEAIDGIHHIDSQSTEERKNFFTPDNIIIKSGETVRWSNSDKIAHLFASFSIIGKGGLFAPNIAPGSSWEYTFTEPGEYYYLCYIHKGMVGKVTVE